MHLPLELIDALAEAAAETLTRARREWEQEFGRAVAEARAALAEIKALAATLDREVREKAAAATAGELAAARTRMDAVATAAEDMMARAEAHVAALEPRAGKDADPVDEAALLARLEARLDGAVAAAADAIPDRVRAAVSEAVAGLPPPEKGEPGTSVTVDDVAPLVTKAVAEAVSAAVAALPPAAPADAVERVAAEVAALRAEVPRQIAEAVAALPPPEDVRPLIAAEIAEAVAALPAAAPADAVERVAAEVAALRAEVPRQIGEAVAALPAPEKGEPGTSVTVDDVAPLVTQAVAEAVSAAVAALPPAEPGKDGVGVADALIDRDDNLVLTLSDGRVKSLGRVVGRDVDEASTRALIGDLVRAAVDAIPRPRDGFGFDDLDVVETEKGYVLRFTRGADVKEFRLPVPTDRGVYRAGETYWRGNGVTWGGHWWIATKDEPAGKPGDCEDWRLAAKRGRDGKEVVKLPPRDPSEPVKFDGGR